MYIKDTDNREFWLRGPIDGLPQEVQPIVLAIRQAQKEIHQALETFPSTRLWDRPGDLASVGFHLQHIRGVLHRLTTYAAGKQLSDRQQEELKKEGQPYAGNESVQELLDLLDDRIDITINQLKEHNAETLAGTAFVGRAKIPSTHGGILFHAAEHTMRHTGQLLVTAHLMTIAKL